MGGEEINEKGKKQMKNILSEKTRRKRRKRKKKEKCGGESDKSSVNK